MIDDGLMEDGSGGYEETTIVEETYTTSYNNGPGPRPDVQYGQQAQGYGGSGGYGGAPA